MGAHSPIDAEWVKGSIAAVTSEYESFGLTIIEAMAAGLPVVSTACRMGPLELIDDEVDGLLVTPGDIGAIASGLRKLIENPELRQRMSEAAVAKAHRYTPDIVVAQHEDLFQSLQTRATSRTRPTLRLRDRLTRGTYRRLAIADRVHRSDAGLSVSCRSLALDEVEFRLGRSHPEVCLVKKSDQTRVTMVAKSSSEPTVFRVDTSALPESSAGIWTLAIGDVEYTVDYVDNRILVDAAEPIEIGTVVVPFKDAGRLSFRVRKTRTGAEVDAIDRDGESMRIRGTFRGVSWSEEKVTAEFRTADRPSFSVPVAVDGSRFTATIPAGDLMGAHEDGLDIWGIWLFREAKPEFRLRPSQSFGEIVTTVQTRQYVRRSGRNQHDVGIELWPQFQVNGQLSIRVNAVSPPE